MYKYESLEEMKMVHKEKQQNFPIELLHPLMVLKNKNKYKVMLIILIKVMKDIDKI